MAGRKTSAALAALVCAWVGIVSSAPNAKAAPGDVSTGPLVTVIGGGIDCNGVAFGGTAAPLGSVSITASAGQLSITVVGSVIAQDYSIEVFEATGGACGNDDLAATGSTWSGVGSGSALISTPHPSLAGEVLGDGLGSETAVLVLDNRASACGCGDTYVARVPINGSIGPSITDVFPSELAQGTSGTVSITGSGFAPGASVAVSNADVAVGTTTVVDGGTISIPLTASPTAALGPFGLTVTNPDTTSATCGGCVAVVAGSAPAISGTPPTPGDVGQPYGPFTFALAGAPFPTTTVTAGALPPGLSLDSIGNLGGTPTTPGLFNATITASNGIEPSDSAAISIEVQGTPLGPSISIGDAAVVEGDGGNRSLTFAVTLSEPAAAVTAVSYTIEGDGSPNSASPGSDFKAKTSTVTFKPAASTGKTPTTKFVTATIYPDVAIEGDETLQVILSNPGNGYLLDRAAASGTIIDDDPIGAANVVGVGDVTIVEGDVGVKTTSTNSAKVWVTLTAPAATTATVTVTVTAGSATEGNDFKAVKTKIITFNVGQRHKAISVPVYPDLVAEGDETIVITLSAATGGPLLGRAAGSVTIVDNE